MQPSELWRMRADELTFWMEALLRNMTQEVEKAEHVNKEIERMNGEYL